MATDISMRTIYIIEETILKERMIKLFKLTA